MAETGTKGEGPYRSRIGSYGLGEPLGSGGTSSVFRAVHLETGHEVALKVLPSYMARNPTVLKRFVGEVRSAESLQHPNIVSIYDRGSQDGRYYLVLEYVEGGDLHDYVQRMGPLPVGEAVGLIAQAARGLEYAASRGVVHRDVKPSNLLRTPLGEVKITDLGLAVRPEAEDERVTREGTTVGTVDYMAPEQARDSRATSFRSDIYSLGCTLHFLLTGRPPFPGGDLTEKLTKHARTPPPDVRERRPDVPPEVAAVVQRMLAKRPEDRYGSYAELLAALGEPARDGSASSVALMPLDDEPSPPRAGREPAGAASARRPPSSVPEISLAAFAPGLLDSALASGPVPAPRADAAPTPALPASPATAPPRPRLAEGVSDDAWIWRCVVIGVIVIVVVIGLDLIIRPFPDPASLRPPESPRRRRAAPAEGAQASAPPAPARTAAAAPAPAEPPPPPWAEPADAPPARRPPKSYPAEVMGTYVPTWAQAPVATSADGPTTVVRRVPGPEDAGAVPSLRLALDVPKGTVELADVGPFPIGDLRIPGDVRVVRSRPGYRATVVVEAPRIDAVRALPGVIPMDGRSLTLDSIDLVVYVRDLGPGRKALFHGSGFDLTLKNCTVTIFNPLRTPFAFLRSEAPSSRPCRVRVEDTLIRGDVAAFLDLGRAPAEVVVLRSIVATDGPLARAADLAQPPDHRVHLLGSAAGCRGPLLDLGAGVRAEGPPRPLRLRAFDSVFGRLPGAGVASLTSSPSEGADLARLLDWSGSNNQYAGWLGYFASGPEHTIRARTLAAFCATWNAAPAASREIAAEWPTTPWASDLAPADLAPFLPGWEELIDNVARPRPFLKSRTLLDFAAAPPVAPAPPEGTAPLDGELTFDADSLGGDLGTFLAEHAAPGARLRVRVLGSGPKRMTPVRLPDGAVVEVRAAGVGPPDAAPLVFAPEARARGDAMIAARGGALALTGLRFRVEEPCRLDALIRVDDGSLALSRCEVSTPAGPGDAPSLIAFHAPSTRPREPIAPPWPLSGPADRPACALSECVLLASGEAIEAEVGMGAIALSRCMVAARGAAFVLRPAAVARSRFQADLAIEESTIAVGGAVVRMSAWPGEAPGPDRPWLISGSNTAYLDLARPARTSVLCRADVECFAQGQVSWSQRDDAIETFGFAVAGDAPAPNRTRDVESQWADLWGPNHVRGVSGPRPGVIGAGVHLLNQPRPDRLEPTDLILDPSPPPGRPRPDVGAPADVARLGRPPAPARR